MLFSSWGRWLRQYSRLAGRPTLPRRPRHPRRLHSRKPLLEVLEDRTLLSVQLAPFSWTAIGPAPTLNAGGGPVNTTVSGRITAVAAQSGNADIVYVATAGGGIWKTTNATSSSPSWTPLTDHVTDSNGNPVPEFMGAITIDPTNPNILYAGTGEPNNAIDNYYGDGVLKSTDGGQTWQVFNANGAFYRRAIGKIVVDPTDDQNIYVAVSDEAINGLLGNTGIWKSSDGGKTWVNTTGNAPNNLTTTDSWSDLVMDPQDPSVLYAAVGTFYGSGNNGIYETMDGGNTWKLLSGDSNATSASSGRIALAISHPASASQATLYAAISNNSNYGLLAFDTSTDGGTTWTTLKNTPDFLGGNNGSGQGFYDIIVAADPNNPQRVFAGGQDDYSNLSDGIIESTDGGNTWKDLTNGNDSLATAEGPHTDHHGMAFDANGDLLDGNDGGIWRFDDVQNAWTNLNGNLNDIQFEGAYLNPVNANIVYGGSQDNGTEEFTGSLPWTQIVGGDGGPSRVDPGNVNGPGNPPTIYQEYAGGTPTLERSDNGGISFKSITTGLSGSGNFYPAYALQTPVPVAGDAGDPGRILFGTDSLFESTDFGNDWTEIGKGGTKGGFNPNDDPIDFIATAPSDAPTSTTKTVYVSAGGGTIFVTHNDNGTSATWTSATLPAGDTVKGLAVDPTDPNYAYAVVAGFEGAVGQVFETTDGGTTWKSISGNLPNVPADSVLIDPRFGTKNSRTVYVGTDTGVYFTQDASTSAPPTWSVYGAGLPNAQVVDLDMSTTLEAGQGVLLAATHGRGAWEVVPELIQGGFTFKAKEGIDPGAQQVAGFYDAGGAAAGADYTATIDWGDGTPATQGSITFNPLTGLFVVSGDHTYVEEGPDTIHVTITNTVTGIASTVTSSATVSDPSVRLTAVSLPAQAEGAASGPLTLATFTDPGGAEGLSDYAATINWGDKTPPTTGIITYSGGTFTVSGSHTYAEEGAYTATVTVNHDAAPAASVTSSVTVSDPSVLPTGGFVLSGTEGATLRSQVVATFTDPGGAEALKDYSATIDWGDQSPASAGVLLYSGQPGDPAGVFTVEGTHKYAEDGSFTITVRLTHDTSTPAPPVTSTANIADVQITARSLTINAPEGTVPRTITVATFTDPGGAEPTTDYSATIDWGDGSPVDSGGEVTIGYNTATGVFSVLGSHAYGEAGSNYPVTVTITHDQLPAVTVNGIARVIDVPVSVTGVATLTASEGEDSGPEVVATFTDPGGALGLSHYAAVIDWGDNTTPTAGTISGPDANGTFSVTGDHTYTEEGTYTPTVTVHHDTAPNASGTGTVTVLDQQINLTAGTGVTLPEGGGGGVPQVVATFTDPGGAETTADYTATIDWGDGSTPTAGTIAGPDANGTFSILGTHDYGEEGSSYTLTVTASHAAEPALTVTETATVIDVPVSATGGYTVTAVEGALASVQPVATFTDPGGVELDGAYSATIDWGDGTPVTAGTIVGPDSKNVFTVEGSHTYREESPTGQPYTVSVAVFHDATPAQTVTSSAVVSDPAVQLTAGGSVSAVEGQAFAPQLLATFTDPAGAETTADYTATIDWGDGQTSAGVVSPDATPGVFDVSGGHRYGEEGSYTATVTVLHDAAPAASATDPVAVSDPPVVGQGGFVFTDNRGLPSGSQVVATFTDPAGAETTADYTATIDWGDGSTPTAGTITAGGPLGASSSTFSVLGSHVYATPGPHAITVTLGHESATSVQVSSTAVVSEAAVAAAGGRVFSAIESVNSGNEVVATFTDPAGAVALNFYSATINWGDGTSSPGTISYGGAPGSTTGVFSVLGNHLYQNGSSPPISVTIHHTDAPDATVTSSSSVTPVLSLVRVFASPLQKGHTVHGRTTWTQTVLVLNTSPYPLSGHFALVLAGLGVAVRHGKLHSTGVHLMSPTGFVRGPLGTMDPYVAASFNTALLNTPPGGVFLLRFTAPAGVPVQFTPILEEGTNVP